MEKIRIESTDVSPEVIFDIENNIFSIKGKSVVTEVDSFYAPLIEWLENATQNIMIPMQGEIDSLNVSVAAGILIFEAVRQRQNK